MGQTFTLGRGDDNDIVIASPYLSSKHLTIEVIDANNLIFRIIDQQSTNGTFVNGSRIEKADISPSDQVHLGEYVLKPADYLHKVAPKSAPTIKASGTAKTTPRTGLITALIAGILLGSSIAAVLLTAQQWLIISVQATTFGMILCAIAYAIMSLKQKSQSMRFAAELQKIDIQRLQEQIDNQQQKQKSLTQKSEFSWNGFRKFEVIRKQPECEDITSFYLSAHDGNPIPTFFPGQYLTFNAQIPNEKKPAIRCYSLSDAPSEDHYRISVKRQLAPPSIEGSKPGLVSSYFHDQISEGDILDVKAPAGGFYLDVQQPKPVVLLAGGIGITPMLSILNGLIGQRSQHDIWLFYGVRNNREVIHLNHLRSLAESHDNVKLVLCFSQPQEHEKIQQDFDVHARVSIGLLKKNLPSNNYDFYLCGPGPFMQSLTDDLREWGVPDDHIHSEAFGPSSVGKKTPASDIISSHKVLFAKSDKSVVWNGEESLLELAENSGIDLDYGCRAGNCGTCLVALREGEVGYTSEHDAAIEKGSCLACICQPTSDLIIDA